MSSKITFDDLAQAGALYLSPGDISALENAYLFAANAHQSQLRVSGEPYIYHPMQVTLILMGLNQDLPTLIAALLHDTVEDTDITSDDLSEKFGDEVRQLVDGVTKISQLRFHSHEEEQAENYRKMVVAMAQDLRVVMIKLADRLHNMRTIKVLRLDKQQRIARETMEIYAPLAHRLGIASIKWELEDLAFMVLEPEAFQKIKSLVVTKRKDREKYLETFVADISSLIQKEGLEVKIVGRPKHFYSIYCKLEKSELSFDELYDALGIRVLAASIRDCYTTLGIIHSAYTPITGRFKDYIALPKQNRYQSLHTTVLGPEGKPVEIQIRTAEMDKVAEYGIAAHWGYKEGRHAPQTQFDFIKDILEIQREAQDPKEFIRDLKTNLFSQEVYVFTPRGDIKVLSKGATALDFAYQIHTQIGHQCVGAKVNGLMVTLDHVLNTGDRVEVMTSPKQYPRADWLQLVTCRHSISKIKQWLAKQHHDRLIEEGYDKLDRLLKSVGLSAKKCFTDAQESHIFSVFDVASYEALYRLVALGDLSPKEVVRYFQPDYLASEPVEEVAQYLSTQKRKGHGPSILIMGEKGVQVTCAKCCSPLPGDDIIGIVVIGKGVSVHRSDCNNVLHAREETQMRFVQAEWASILDSNALYFATLEVEAFDKVGILQEILDKISSSGTNIHQLRTLTLKSGGKMKAIITVQVSSSDQIARLKSLIFSVPDVYGVMRI